MVPYASDLLLQGVLYRGMGDACFIKAPFSPGIVLYQMYNGGWGEGYFQGPPSQRQIQRKVLHVSTVFVS